MGCAVLDEVYDGNPDAWRSSDSVPLRALAQEAGVSVSTLYRYVAVAALWRRCGQPELHHLGISHLRELLPLHPGTQADLLERAEDERWTVTEMRRVASLHQRRPEVAGRGRPPRSPGYLVALQHIQSWVETDSRLEGLENANQMCDAEALQLLKTIQVARMELEMVEMRVGRGRNS
ncbi:MAG: hypothetical protein H6737_18750 [Alphaproteobacteria bacterium]|nr:hypothetical protein [Alphaproteobacteria bacterium]